MTRLKSLLFISICVLIYAIYYWIVPVVVNIQGRVPIIQDLIKREFGMQIELKDPELKMGLSPSIWIEASNFSIIDKNSLPLSISNPKVKIKLLPMLIGQIELAYFSCDNINADLKIDKKNRFYIGDNLILKTTNPRISVENSKMNIGNYSIALEDELQNKNILFSGDYFDLNKFNSKKYVNFSTNSKIKVNGRTSIVSMNVDFQLPFKKTFESDNIVFDGTITNLNLADFSSYIKNFSNNKIQETRGIININADTMAMTRNMKRVKTQMALDNLSIILKDKHSSIFFKNKLNITSISDISKNSINIKKFKLTSKNIDISLNGKISQISSKNPNLDLSIALKKTLLENLIPLIPTTDSNTSGFNIIAMKKYGLNSNLDGNLSIKGDTEEPEIMGEFNAINSYFSKLPHNSAPNFASKLKFLGKTLSIEVILPTSQSEKAVLKGTIGLYGEKISNLSVTSTPNLDLEIVQAVLNPLHEILCFEIGPLPIMKLQGITNVNFKILGNKQDPYLDGVMNFKNATGSFNGFDFKLRNVDGTLYFKAKDTHFVTRRAYLNGKPIKIDGKCSLFGILDFNISSASQDLGDLIAILEKSPSLKDIKKNIPIVKTAGGKLNLAVKLAGRIKSLDDFILGKTVFLSGHIKLLGINLSFNSIQFPINSLFGDIDFKGTGANFNLYSFVDQTKIYLKGKIKDNIANIEMNGNLKNNKFIFSGIIKNIFQKNQIVDAKFTSDNFDLSALKNLIKYPFLAPVAKSYITQLSNPTGNISLKATIKNNILNSRIKLNDVAFRYSALNIPVKIFSGNIEINNENLSLYKVNTMIDSMPILVDGTVMDIFKNPRFNIYINSKPSQKFIDKYINKNALYPLKIKGDIIYSTRVNGTKEAFSAKTEINMQANSSIYYMGSTLGDINDPIRIFLDTHVSKNSIFVGNFQYDKLISSQNNKEFVSPQLAARGQIYLDKNNIKLNNFRIKTITPTDAKIFNIIFKKPMIKQGLFSANILINNTITSPKLIGSLSFNGIDIPLLDTTIKDISLDFDRDNIDLKSKGEVFGNKIILFATMQNRLTAPYIIDDIDLYLGNLDVNQIIKSLNKLEFDADMNKISDVKNNFDISGITVKNGKLKADSVFVKNVFAKDLISDFSLNEKLIFALKDFKFDVADGTANGNFKYNLLNSNANLELHMDKVNANTMSETLFDLKNQIFGSLTGQVDLTCNGKSHKTCMDTLSGTGGFRVAEGRMPKLGSLEYLLKSANLIRSGVTGITINSIIELLTPLKTGQFENINGNFSITSGLADSVQIYSKGKDLSIFITGTYNFSTLIADMEVFGRVSKKISNILGSIGNASLNTLFNTIPGLNLEEANSAKFIKNLNKIPGFELNDKLYRIFSAKIYGDINGENYVESFKWVD